MPLRPQREPSYPLPGGASDHAPTVANPFLREAGTAVDKGEVAARAEWAGVAVNLRTSTPTEQQIRGAVDNILADGSFRATSLRLKAENEAMDALGAIEKWIWGFTG